MTATYKEYSIVRKCLLEIEEMLAWGDSSNWHSQVFMELSELILQKTNVLLSPTTLKRVWGKVSYSHSPSINTLNTLSQFAGYTNWRAFKHHYSEKYEVKSKETNRRNQLKILTYACLLAIIFISLFSFIGQRRDVLADFDFSQIEFQSRPITKSLPNSVVFDFDLKGLNSDSIFIQQYWDVTKTIKINADQHQATGLYYYPGYFRSKLLVDGDIKLEHDLYIKSNGWLGTIDYDPVPKYFHSAGISAHGALTLPEEGINAILSHEKPLQSSFHFVDELGNHSGDSFKLKAAVRNLVNERWAVCETTKLVILGTKGAMIIPFTIPGCISEINLMLNDVYINGKENDLSAFGTDLSDFREIGLSIENKNVRITLDDETIYLGRYQSSIGNLAGIRFRFLGAGEVDFIKVSNLDGQIILSEDF